MTQMTKYKCGHKSDTILMENTIIGMSEYLVWKDSVGFDGDKSLCFDCYLKNKQR